MLALGIGAHAQVGPPLAANPNSNNGYGFVQSSGTYAPLSSSRTIWQAGATLATNAVSNAVSLPFTFKYNGKSYTNIYISNNGYITFGSPTTATTYAGLSSDLTTVGNIYEGAIAGFAVNLRNTNTTTSEIAYETVGSKFVVQFTDLQGNSASAAQAISFQIQLDSSNNSVAIVYGTCASGTATLTGEVGLKGAESSDVNNRTGTNWTTSAIGTSNSSTMTLGTSGAATIPASGLTFTFTPGTWLNAPTSYATLPFTESFGSWVNGNSTADLPNATYWRTWPSRGDNSWRASDISTSGFTSASGWNTVLGGATVAAPAVAPTARFHSYNTVGASGYMDLYVDLSTGGAGNRVISFDYINTSGTDKLDVLLSTDGGVTFNSLGASLGVAAAWANKTFTTSSTASTAIIRFLGTGDNGSTDIQIDNLTVTVSTTPPACTTISSPANAATGVSINPTISWNSASLATSYIVNIGTTAGGTNVMNAVDVGNVTSYTIPVGTPLNYSTQYYITIFPKNAYGTASGCTETSFTTSVIPCPSVTAPAAAAVGVSTSAVITWSAVPGATGYRLTVGTTTNGTDVLNNVDLGNLLSYTFSTPLNPATKYFYKVNAYSASSTSASCSERSFTTICSASNVPYSENFDTTAVGSSTNTNAPTCWKYLEPTGWAGYGYVSTTAFTSSPNGYYIYTDTATTGGGMLVSPQTTNLTNGNNRVRFSANGGGSGYTMEVGTLSDPNDAATFVAIGSPISLTTTMSPYIVNIPAGTNQYLAFRHGGGSSRSIRLDDIFVEVVPSCLEPTAIVTANITNAGATIGWTAPTTVPSNGYEVYYSTSNTAPTATTVLDATNSVTSTTTSAPISGLSAATAYYVWVRSACSTTDKSVWSLMATFTTACNAYVPSYTNDFSTFPGTCWTLANGGTPSTGPGTGTTNYWVEDGFLNNTSTGAARINLYSTGRAGWLISPVFNLTAGGYQVKFNYGITTYSGTGTSAMGSDDIVNVLMSTDNGVTWTIIQTWNAANAPSNTNNTFTYNIASTSNQVKFAVFGSDGTVGDTPDYNFYVDNFIVETAPTCLEPTAIIASNITAAGATISWTAPATAPANGYEYYYSTVNTAPTATTTISGTSATVSTPLSGLAAATTYYVWVRSVCSTTDKSVWSSNGTFTTSCVDITSLNENFDSTSSTGNILPNCWSKLVTGTSSNAYVQASTVMSAPNNLYIYGNSATEPVIVKLPSITNLSTGNYAIKFKGRANYTAGGKIDVGYMTDPANASTFVTLGTYTTTSNTVIDDYYLAITGVPAGVTTLALRNAGSPAYSVLIDDLMYDLASSLGTSNVASPSKENIQAYPNPFADVLNISDISNVKSISVVDISGKLVKTFDKPESALHLRDLNSGMYLVILNMKDGSKQTIKAIKK